MTQPSSIPHPVGRQRDGDHDPIHQTKIPISHRRSGPQDLEPLPGIPAPVFTEGMAVTDVLPARGWAILGLANKIKD